MSGPVNYRVAVFVDHGTKQQNPDRMCEARFSNQARARDFALNMLLNIHLTPDRADSGMFWCELSHHPRDSEVTGAAPGGCGVDSGQESAPAADRVVDAVYLNESGELTWDLAASAQRWRSALSHARGLVVVGNRG